MIVLLFVLLSIVSCAPLNPTFTPLEKTGEVVGRTILCPLTLCFSEFAFYQEYKSEQKREAYEQWRASLSPEEQDREDRRQAEAARSLAIAISGGGPGFMASRHNAAQVFLPARTQRTPTNCTTNVVGTSMYTNCY